MSTRYEGLKNRISQARKFELMLPIIIGLIVLYFGGIKIFALVAVIWFAMFIGESAHEHWIEEREFEIEWLKLKIEYLQSSENFSKADILAKTIYLNDCYDSNSEVISEISAYSAIPNERYSKFLNNLRKSNWKYKLLPH